MSLRGSLGRRLLEVNVIEAEGLLGTDSSGVSNPRVDVSLVDLGEREDMVEGIKQTRPMMGTVNPVWNHKVVFGRHTNLSRASRNLPTLRLQVYSVQHITAGKPLGKVDIPLVNLSSDGEAWERWYNLEAFGSLKPGARLGRIHLKVKIGAVVDARYASSRFLLDANRAMAGCGDEEEGYEDQPPNYLRVTLHGAQDLMAKNFFSRSSDPMAILKIAGQERRSTTKYKTLNPEWEDIFEFHVSHSGDPLEITLEGEGKTVNHFLGFVSVLMGDLADKRKRRQRFNLTLKNGDLPPGKNRGTIEITAQWYFNPNIGPEVQTDSDEETETKDEEEIRPVDSNAQLRTAERDRQETMRQKEEKQQLLKMLRDFKVVTGDYMAYVHIIEVRDLKGEDLQGTSDPVVYVEAFGQKFATEVVHDRLNAVFDETFVFNLRNLDVDEFKEGVFRISVMDADMTLNKNLGSLKMDLIGAVSFDATYIYFRKNHEIHRRWVALVDDQNPEDVGTQGYLHLSIAIVGPRDTLEVHDEEADRRKERQTEMNAGGLDALVVMPPSIELKSRWLVSTVIKAEYLPVMDDNVIGLGGGDFVFQAEVAGGKPFCSKKIPLIGERHKLNPEWRAELWQPITTPCMSGNIKYSILDLDSVRSDIVGVFYSKIGDVEKKQREEWPPKSRWVNLYGSPLGIPENQQAIKKLSKRTVTLGYKPQINYRHRYDNFPHHAPTYRGRVLIKEKIVDVLPQKHKKERTAFRRKIKMPQVPLATDYVLRVFVGGGIEIPRFVSLNPGHYKKMWLRFSLGRHEVSTIPVDNENGVCKWYNSLDLNNNIMLPQDPDQLPDLVIHLMVGAGVGAQPCAFRRLPAKDLIKEEFGGKPQWLRLREDKVLDLLGEHEFPGSILARVGLGTVETYLENRGKWKESIQGLLKREPYELRVHVYQARDLPAADSNGLMDPYLKIKFDGKEKNTEKDKETRRRATVDPLWYKTERIQASLPSKEYQAYFPQVTIQLFDWDLNWSDDYCGNLFLSLNDIEIIQADQRTKTLPPPPTPKWESFYMEEPGDGQGELLVSVQLINMKSAELPKPESIIPEKREAWLDMVVLGIRNMQPFQYLPMQLPFCAFEVVDMDGKRKKVTTEPSSKPTGQDANFLQHIKMKLQLPKEAIYAPNVKIRVSDTRLGGFSVPLVGTGRIELGKKLPWGPEYEPPLAKMFGKDALLRAVTTVNEGEVDADEPPPRLPGDITTGGVRTEDEESQSRSEEVLRLSSSIDSDDDIDRPELGRFDLYISSGSSAGGSARSGLDGRDSLRPSLLMASGSGRRSLGYSPAGRGGYAGGGGALGVLREQSDEESIDEAPQVAAGNQVRDTGIGAILALDVAKQQPEQHQYGGTEGVEEEKNQSQEQTQQDGATEREEGKGQPQEQPRQTKGLWPEEDDYEMSETPAYLVSREMLDHSLEEELASTPFETYDLVRGQTIGLFIGGPGNLKVVGKLKCIVRVTEGDPSDEPLFVDKDAIESLQKAKKRNDAIMDELLKPRGYKIRLYVLQALNLTPMDMGFGGRPGKSDPYLRVKLGKESFDDRKNYIENTVNADIYKCIEINCELPGAGQLQVEVMDRDEFGGDDLIGRTTIDLEDRWFDTRWQAWGLPNRCEDRFCMRFQTKPLETRTLKVPTSLAPQGQLRCWVDIMALEDAKAFPQDDVSLPPARDFEVRVVFWKCKDVVAMDTLLEQNDLFVRSWIEGCDSQETDTHWFAKKGKGSFNWRMKFKVSLGPRTRAWKFPYLTVQLWDRDVLKWNDHIAEGQLDLGPYFRKVYKLKETVKLFQKIDPKLKQKQEEAIIEMGNMEIDRKRSDDPMTAPLIGELPPPEYDPVALGIADPPPGYTVPSAYTTQTLTAAEGAPPSDGQEESGDLEEGDPAPARPNVTVAAATDTGKKKKSKASKPKKRGFCYWFCRCCCPCPPSDIGQVSPVDKDDEEDEADAKALIKQIKNVTGLWDEDPDESYWLTMERTNHETGRKEQMGKCLVSVQIWPIEKAEQLPAGTGRNDPNSNPFLPPPTGRLRFSLNPFVMGTELFGAKICCRIVCCCCCILLIVLMVYFSSFFNFLFSIALKFIF